MEMQEPGLSESQCYVEGMAAAREGRRSPCPYAAETLERADWEAGFAAARRDPKYGRTHY